MALIGGDLRSSRRHLTRSVFTLGLQILSVGTSKTDLSKSQSFLGLVSQPKLHYKETCQDLPVHNCRTRSDKLRPLKTHFHPEAGYLRIARLFADATTPLKCYTCDKLIHDEKVVKHLRFHYTLNPTDANLRSKMQNLERSISLSPFQSLQEDFSLTQVEKSGLFQEFV